MGRFEPTTRSFILLKRAYIISFKRVGLDTLWIFYIGKVAPAPFPLSSTQWATKPVPRTMITGHLPENEFETERFLSAASK
jgi:hypothetical protein